jgi:hypothetical protein
VMLMSSELCGVAVLWRRAGCNNIAAITRHSCCE